MYALKFVVRAESPRDYVDVLLSMKYQPNVVLIDMAHMVAVHGNHRKPGMFSPYEGRVAPATEANIKAAQEGKLTVDMPWLIDSYRDSAPNRYQSPTHPLTGMQNASA